MYCKNCGRAVDDNSLYCYNCGVRLDNASCANIYEDNSSFGFAVLGFFRRELNVMELGHEEAECLGVNTRLTMFVAIGAVAMATAVSVALAGAVGFVGLVVPHIVRRLVAVKMEILLPISALIGGIMVVAAEYVGRLLPGDVGVGVVCAVLGAPFFLYLLATPSAGEGRDI